MPSLNKKFKVFKKKVVGINVQGEGRASMNPYSQKVEVGFYIKIGSGGWKKIYSDSFQGRDLTSGEVVKREYTWGKTFVSCYLPIVIKNIFNTENDEFIPTLITPM